MANPENRPSFNIQVIEGTPPEPVLTPEENVAILLEFLSSISTAWVRIDYTILGEPQQMTTESLKRNPSDTDEDRRLFLLQKADELLCSENRKIRLINPDKPKQKIEVNPLSPPLYPEQTELGGLRIRALKR